MGRRASAKKRAWFALGAQEFRSVFRGDADEYACPLCVADDGDGLLAAKIFGPQSVEPHTPESEKLTLEDVPPRHSGGRPLVLTCKACNSRHGHTTDGAAFRVRRGERFNIHGGTWSMDVIVDGIRVRGNVTLGARREFQRIEVLPTSPTTIAALNRRLTASPAKIRLEWETLAPTYGPALVSDLKAAYLAAFALFGYRYNFSARLRLVRRQISDPALEHLPPYVLRLSSDFESIGPQIGLFDIPGTPPFLGAQMGRRLVVLPWADDPYSHLRALPAGAYGPVVQFGWPSQPNFAHSRAIGISP